MQFIQNPNEKFELLPTPSQIIVVILFLSRRKKAVLCDFDMYKYLVSNEEIVYLKLLLLIISSPPPPIIIILYFFDLLKKLRNLLLN